MIEKKDFDIFRTEGFLLINRLISNELIGSLKNDIEKLMKQDYETGIIPDKVKFQEYNGSKIIHSQCNVWKSSLGIQKIILNKKIAEIACYLMQWSGVKLNQDTLFHVPPGFGPTSFHQDNPYQNWHTSNGVITAIIALEDIEENMGGLIFVPKSHVLNSPKKRIKEDFIGSLNPQKDFENLVELKQKNKLKKHKLLMKKGDVSLHHGDLWHGSGINKSSFYRKTISIHYMEKDAKFVTDTKNPWFSRYMLKNSNEMHDSFFPTLFFKPNLN